MATFREDFESPDPGWFFAGQVGSRLRQRAVALRREQRLGSGDRRAACDQQVPSVFPHTNCTAIAWLRLSETLTDGYFSVRGALELNGTGRILREVKLVGPGPANPEHRGYNRYELTFNSGRFSRVLVYVGLWGVGRDAWIQVDDVEITSRGNPEDDVVLNPV